MDLKQYIRRNYKTPNPQILSDLGANEELIAYLRHTPGNTNFNVSDPYCGGGGTEPVGEVWYTGAIDECDPKGGNANVKLTPTAVADGDALINNPNGYSVVVNGENLSYSAEYNLWTNSKDFGHINFIVEKDPETEELLVFAIFDIGACKDGLAIEVTVTKK